MFRLAVLASLFSLTAAAAPLTVHLVSSIDGAKTPPDPSEKRVKLGTTVTLHAAAEAKELGLVSETPKLVTAANGAVRSARPPGPGDGAVRIRWYKVEPAVHSLSNTDPPPFHWEPVTYRDVPLQACDDRWTCPADVHASILEDHHGLGTMAFRVEITLGDRTGSSPGAEKLYRGGLRPDVARVTVRRDDTYLGWLTELYNTPYIWASAGDDKVHQAERRIGSDCADFVTYGVRRLGYEVPYTSTWTIADHGRTLAKLGGPGADGIYRDAAGTPVAVGDKGVKPGDLLLFPGHVGTLAEDRAPLGVLDTHDVMMHTCWHEPTEQSIGDSGYGNGPVQVIRWKVFDGKPKKDRT